MEEDPVKVWVDILTPKQVLFLQPLIERFEKEGVQTLVTTRNYQELNRLSKMRRLKAKVVGKHGGGTVYRKLLSSTSRTLRLAKLVEDEKVDLAISYSSVESARVAFGLSIPHYCISDSPHAEAVSKLTVPLSQTLFTPSAIPLKAWTRYGIEKERIIQYEALDPYVWISRKKPYDRKMEKRLIILRPEEELASYLLHEKKSITTEVLEKLTEPNLNARIIVLPRYREQLKEIKRRFQGKVEIIDRAFDGLNLITSSTVFIGGGGTMTAEAALTGTPTISIYPAEPTYIDKYLINKTLMVRRLDPDYVSKFVKSYLIDGEKRIKLQQKADALLEGMEDPVEKIASTILHGEAT